MSPLYGEFIFPIKSTNQHLYFLKNDFSSFDYFSGVRRSKGFLKEEIRQSRVQLKSVLRLENTFFVVTVVRYIRLDFWHIDLYNTKFGRNYTCKIFPTDFNYMKAEFYK